MYVHLYDFCVCGSMCVCMCDHKPQCDVILSNAIYLLWNVVCYFPGAHNLGCPASNPREHCWLSLSHSWDLKHAEPHLAVIFGLGDQTHISFMLSRKGLTSLASLFLIMSLWWILKMRDTQHHYIVLWALSCYLSGDLHSSCYQGPLYTWRPSALSPTEILVSRPMDKIAWIVNCLTWAGTEIFVSCGTCLVSLWSTGKHVSWSHS